MKYISKTTEFQFKNTCVTLGKFDGLHLGHQLLLSYLEEYEKQGFTSIMFTFDYHPENLFSEKEIDLIYTEEEKVEILRQNGPQVLISYPFTRQTAAIEPEEFIEKVLCQSLDAKVIVVGADYRFGKQRRGDVTMLQKYADVYGYQLIVCEKLKMEEKVISSTRIREEIRLGHMEHVNHMLGAPYRVFGTVVSGQKLGRTIGIPTVNLLPPAHKLLPPNGVYAAIVKVNQAIYQGIANVGCKPTVSKEHQIGVETYLFDYQGDLYGQQIEVSLLSFIREEKRFSNIEELKEQVNQDIRKAKDYLKQC